VSTLPPEQTIVRRPHRASSSSPIHLPLLALSGLTVMICFLSFRGEADVHWPVSSRASVADDP